MYFKSQILLPYLLVTIAGKESLQELCSKSKNTSRDNNRNSILDWVAPEKLKNKFPYYLSGYDYDDKPVVVMELGKWDHRSVAEKGGEDLENLTKHYEQFWERIRSGFYQKSHRNDSKSAFTDIALILDYDGFKFEQMLSPANMKFQMKMNVKFGKIFDQIAYGFALNASPVVESMLAFSKPFLGSLLERLEICGTISRTWIPKLLRKIPRSQLPPAYGGTEDFTPLAVYG